MSQPEDHGIESNGWQTFPPEMPNQTLRTPKTPLTDGGDAEETTEGCSDISGDNVVQELKSPTIQREDESVPLERTENEEHTTSLISPPTEKMAAMHLELSSLSPINPGVSKKLPAPPPPPRPPAAGEKPYVDPTPKTPLLSRRPSPESRSEEFNEKDIRYASQPKSPERREDKTVEADGESASEIQSIIDQFDEEGAPTKEEIMSPRHEVASPVLSIGGQFPPRKSSLEPLRSRDMDSIAASPVLSHSEKLALSPPPVPPKPDTFENAARAYAPLTSESTPSLHSQPPPPDPEPDLPFDFHRFLEQLKHKSADPVAKFLRSFLTEFGKKEWMVHEQVKIIGDFLAFISVKMAQCDVWRDVSETEFDNAKEGVEKLVMNRLYYQTFSPAIPPATQPPRVRGKGRDPEKSLVSGRRGQHQEDVERDEILAQKIRIYSWVREEHLDIPPVGPNGERFLKLAQQELLKIKSYRAPRDKVICVLNCCKVIFGLLKNIKSTDTSADAFVPLLIYVVLQANPEHLVSNIQYVLRFRNQDKLGGEAGYYLSSLSGAIQFIESLDRTTLTVSDEEFERNVELAVSAIAEQNRAAEATGSRVQRLSEKSTLAEPELTPRNSMDYTSSSPAKPSRLSQYMEGTSSDSAPEETVSGLLRTIQKPLSAIGRILSDTDSRPESGQVPSPQPSPAARLSPSVFQPPPSNGETHQRPSAPHRPSGMSYDAQEAAARQASAETAQARRIQRQEHRNVVETLYGMFPNLDKEVIDDVVRQKEGRVGLAVDACLALTAGA